MSESRRSPDDERVVGDRSESLERGVEQRPCRLACGLGVATTGSGRHSGNHRSVAGGEAPFGGKGLVEVGRDPSCPGGDGVRRLGELAPAGVGAETLDNHDRSVVGRLDQGEARIGDGVAQTCLADDENLRAGRE